MDENGPHSFLLLISILLFLFMCGCTSPRHSIEEYEPVENTKAYNDYTNTIDFNSIDKIKKYLYAPDGSILEIIQYSDDIEKTVHRYEYDKCSNLIKHYYRDCLVEEYIYEDNKCIAEKCYDLDGTLIELHEYTYKQNTLASEYCEYLIYPEVENNGGELFETEFTEYFYKEYNSQGKLVKETCYEYDSEPYINEYKYSNNKAVMKSVTLSGEHFFTETITYDDKGREISIHWLFVEDGSENETVYSYENNQITETYFSDGEKLHYVVNGYNSEGYIVHQIAYSSENEITSLIKFEYDKYNNVNKIQRIKEDEISIQYAPEREYNADGQIISEVYYTNVDYFSDTIMDLYHIMN